MCLITLHARLGGKISRAKTPCEDSQERADLAQRAIHDIQLRNAKKEGKSGRFRKLNTLDAFVSRQETRSCFLSDPMADCIVKVPTQVIVLA